MKKSFGLLSVLWVLSGQVNAQPALEIIPSLGRTSVPALSYQNSSGIINPSLATGLSIIYHPSPAWGFELNLTNFHPTTYLNNSNDERVRVYTYSTVNVSRLSAGINYSFPVRRFRPYIGYLAGFSETLTKLSYKQGTYRSFSGSLQAGTAYYFSGLIGLRLNICATILREVPNNSAWFNADQAGEGFPEFAIGAPSRADMTQWNISLGLIVRFTKSNKQRVH